MMNRKRLLMWLVFYVVAIAALMLGGCPADGKQGGATMFKNTSFKIEDDTMSSKHPQFVPELTQAYASRHDDMGWINASQSVIGLDMVGLTEENAELKDKIFPNFGEAIKQTKNHHALLFSLDQVDSYTKQTDDQVYSMLEIINHKGSEIYRGGKQGFLSDLLKAIEEQPSTPEQKEALIYILAALQLGGYKTSSQQVSSDEVTQEIERFESLPCYSKPVGFYTNLDILKNIFKRDRLLQQPFGTEPLSPNDYPKRNLAAAVVMARALKNDSAMLEAYGKYLRLADVMTNPSSNLSLLDLMPYEKYWDDPDYLMQELQKSPAWQRSMERGNVNPMSIGVAFIPFSTSKENRLFSRIYNNASLPETSTMEDFVGAIRTGDVDLSPEEDSGWYDYQLYALEPLLLPERALEADKLLLYSKYKKRLVNAFKSLATQRRETHIKQVQTLETFGAAPVDYTPKIRLSVEPAATNYLRTARGYAFLQDVLADVYSTEQYENLRLDSMDYYGNLQGPPVSVRIAEACRVFYGLYLISCNDLKMAHSLEPDDIDALEFVALDGPLPVPTLGDSNHYTVLQTGGLEIPQQRYALNAIKKAEQVLHRDVNTPGAFYDARVIVPVLSDQERNKWRYWAVVGVQFKRLKYWYEEQPRQLTFASRDPYQVPEEVNAMFAEGEGVPCEFEESEELIPCYVFVELTLGLTPPTREEFRAVCDKHKTLEEITEALQREF